MPRRLLALVATLSLTLPLSLAAASPAQDLFDQVADLVQNRYGGVSTVDRFELVKNFQKDLDKTCETPGDNCSFEAAFPVIEKEISALGDGHTFFERPDTLSDFNARKNGGSRLQYGLKFGNLENGEQVVKEVVPGSSADAAGLKRGDRLVGIDGQKYTYELLRDSRSKGGPVTLDVRRATPGGEQALQVQITASVSSTRDLPRLEYQEGVAVLRIPTFLSGGGVAQGVHDLVRQAEEKNVRGIVVDLRDNSGGDLAECDMAISAFVPSFTRVAQTARGDNATTVEGGVYRSGMNMYPGVDNPTLWNGPLAVLVNKSSASCSEFFAREIQFAKRGPIIGESTAGVGNTATQVAPLLGGAGLQLTVVHYVKPDGSAYPERVTPEVSVQDDDAALAKGQDVLLQKGFDTLRAIPASATAPSAGN